MIWKKKIDIDQINKMSKGTLSESLGIKFTGFTDDTLIAEMPVDARTFQPAGILHGGASVALAETLGSVGSFLSLDSTSEVAVGLEINANHIRPMKSGKVIGTASALHLGRKTHLWEIKITNEENKLVCISRLTIAIVPKE